MNKKSLPIWIAAGAFLIAAVVGPMFINCLYKHGPGVVTMWEASDMLAYYGTMLGAAITAFSLILTISFTRKQIQRDRFLGRNLERWGKVESIVTQALLDISPLNMRAPDDVEKTLIVDVFSNISTLQAYSLKVKTALNMVKSYITPEEYAMEEDFGRAFTAATEQFYMIEQEFESAYSVLRDQALNGNGEIEDDALVEFFGKTSGIMGKIAEAHNGPYQDLLNKKGRRSIESMRK